MSAATLWILIAVSSGMGNAGTVTVIGRFNSEKSCEATRARMPAQNGVTSAYCLKAEGLLP